MFEFRDGVEKAALSVHWGRASVFYLEFDAPPCVVRGGDLAGCHLESSEQGAGAIRVVIMAMAGQCPAVRELEIALCPLQRLDEGLLVNADDDGVLGRCRCSRAPPRRRLWRRTRDRCSRTRICARRGRSSARAGNARHIGHRHRRARPVQQGPCPARRTLRGRPSISPGRACSSRSCTSAQRPARPFRRDPQAASRGEGYKQIGSCAMTLNLQPTVSVRRSAPPLVGFSK